MKKRRAENRFCRFFVSLEQYTLSAADIWGLAQSVC